MIADRFNHIVIERYLKNIIDELAFQEVLPESSRLLLRRNWCSHLQAYRLRKHPSEGDPDLLGQIILNREETISSRRT